MKKKKKKKLLNWAEKFFNDDKNLTLDPTDYIPQEELDIHLENWIFFKKQLKMILVSGQ